LAADAATRTTSTRRRWTYVLVSMSPIIVSQAWRATGTLSESNLAFSREAADKCYVQHLLWQRAAATWKLVEEKGAHVYVCGCVA